MTTDQNQPQFMVAIECMTYNHKPYILDALNGFVMQKTSFPFIIILVDDASTDGEQEVIREFINSDFDLSDKNVSYKNEDESAIIYYAQHKINKLCYIVYLELKRNLFREPDMKERLFSQWRNNVNYIALCEGDDFWTNCNKLQLQVDKLESDSSLMACVTDSCLVDKDGNVLNHKRGGVVQKDKEGKYGLRDFFKEPQHSYPTASVVYRNTHIDDIRKMVHHTRNDYLGDWTFWIILHTFGNFYYFNEAMTAYRINPTSVTHTCNRVGRAKANIQICNAVADVLPNEYADIAKSLRNTNWVWIDLMYAYKAEKRYLKLCGALFMSAIKCPKELLVKIFHIFFKIKEHG